MGESNHWAGRFMFAAAVLYGFSLGAMSGWHFGERAGEKATREEWNLDTEECEQSARDAETRLDECRRYIALDGCMCTEGGGK